MIHGAKIAWWQIALITFFTLSAFLFEIPRLLFIGGYFAGLGAPFVHDLAVVAPGSAGAHAGMRTGDRLDTRKLTGEQVVRFRYEYNLYRVGSTVIVPVVRAGKPLAVPITIERQRYPPGDAPYVGFVWIVVTLWGVTVLAIGVIVVLARRNIVTVAFFVFTVQAAFTSSTPTYLENFFGTAGVPYVTTLFTSLSILGMAGIVTICIRFPDGAITPAGRSLELLGWSAAVIVQLYLAGAGGNGYFPEDERLAGIAAWLVVVAAVAGFALRYAAADVALRARLRWVGIGLASFVAQDAIFWGTHLHWLRTSFETYQVSFIVNVLPFTFAYAVFRQRVIDVRFAGGRAVLYAVVSAIPFAAFRMTDWLVRTDLEQARIATAIDLLVAVGFGFALNLAKRRVDTLVERTFFRTRYEAERAVRDTIDALLRLPAREDIDAAVVAACTGAMRFQSAAVFERAAADYAKGYADGWEGSAVIVGASEPIVERLRSGKTLAYLEAGDLAVGAPADDCRPVLAVPIWHFDDLDAILFVGRHRNGESPDPTEERIICALASAAGIAYARIDATELKRTVIELRLAADQRVAG